MGRFALVVAAAAVVLCAAAVAVADAGRVVELDGGEGYDHSGWAPAAEAPAPAAAAAPVGGGGGGVYTLGDCIADVVFKLFDWAADALPLPLAGGAAAPHDR
ncbi:hypothetical protein ACP4OV_013865 [Aristida adscensionis]